MTPTRTPVLRPLLSQVAASELVYDGAPLQMETKLAFIARKEEDKAAAASAAAAKPGGAAGGEARGRKRRAEGEPEPADGEEGEDGAGASAEAEAAEVEVPPYEAGCVLRFEFGADVAFAQPPTFGLVKDSFGGRQEGGVVYVDYEVVSALFPKTLLSGLLHALLVR